MDGLKDCVRTRVLGGRRGFHSALLTIVLPLGSCSEPARSASPISHELAAVLSDSSGAVAGRDSSHADGTLASVRHARLLAAHAGVVVADIAPPYLRVFSLQGRLIATAMPRGGGPQEARSVYAVAVSDSNRILVLTPQGLREFAVEDDTVRFVAAHPRPHDVSIFTLAPHCGRGWAAYIPARTRSMVEAPVLAISSRDSSGRIGWQERLSWETYAPSRAWGKLYQMTSDDANVYLRHDYHPRAPILAIPCGANGGPAVVMRDTEAAADDSEFVRVDESRAVAVITYPSTLYTGFAVAQGTLLESETTTDRLADGTLKVTTTFSVADAAGRRSVTVPGEWEIMDARGGEILIAATDPNPRVLLLRTEAILAAVR